MDVRVGHKESWGPKNWCFWNCAVEEDSRRVACTARRSNHSILKKSVLNIHWKRPGYWERLKAEGEGDDRGWDGWMASLTQWTWVWVSSGSWWWTGKPGVLQSMGSQRVGHDWATELNRFRLCLFLKTLALLNYTIQSSDQSSWSINLPMLPNFALIPQSDLGVAWRIHNKLHLIEQSPSQSLLFLVILPLLALNIHTFS